MAALVDTNILVYRVDSRFPPKQKAAAELLRRGLMDDSLRLPHQAVVEFVAAVTRSTRGHTILSQHDALREAEDLLSLFPVLYPNDAMLRLAIRGCAAYQLNWFDAQIWACAEYYGLSEIISEDFDTNRLYGAVRVINPFAGR